MSDKPDVLGPKHVRNVITIGKDKVDAVTLRDTLTGATRRLPVTGVFVAIGSTRATS